MSIDRWCAPASLFLLSAVVAHASEQGDKAAFFEQEIRPVLVEKCIQCHGAKKQEGGLRLDSALGVSQGGDSGKAVEIGLPQQSLIIEALKYESFEMPPSGPLNEKTIASFEKWIAEGAEWPSQSTLLRSETSSLSEEDRQWWAFQPVANHEPPPVSNTAWPRNEIDHFVLHQLESRGMQPAPEADKKHLVRRLYFDLIGLPPTQAEIERFVADTSADAWEILVDRLLDDPRYGEHWARYWLDLVRYCESDGWNQDAYRPHTWRYRDYVVRAFNSDKPYPEFVMEQLAGDELAASDPELKQPDQLIAAGFLRLGIYEYNQRDARGHWNDIMNEMTDVTGEVFLGLSMSCSRCHDHKFDPLPQRDYFKLRSFLEPVVWRDDLVGATAIEQREHRLQMEKWELATASIREKIEKIVDPYNNRKWLSTVDKFPLDIQACFNKQPAERNSWEEQMAYLVSRQFIEEGGGPLKSMKKEDQAAIEKLEAQLAAFDELKPPALPQIATVTNHSGAVAATTIPDDPDQVPVAPGFLSVMEHLALPEYHTAASVSPQKIQFVSTAPMDSRAFGRRTQLAQWIGDARNPLTTRVIVNRVWQQHFGEGLVASPSDFGRLGSLPSQPELLDWLTADFVKQGWSIKKLHKKVLMSATWRQSVTHPQADRYSEIDPAEKLLWRAKVRRLKAEQIRDAMLVASGELRADLGGPSVEENAPRRGLYVKSFRNNLDTFMHSFDLANGSKSVAERDATTTPTQALLLFNGSYSLGRAKQMAQRLLGQKELKTPVDILQHAFVAAWGRTATESELTRALQYVGASPGEQNPTVDVGRLTDFCHILFNSNEFLYLN